MLHDARMAGLAKLRRSIRSTDERQLWAVSNGGLGKVGRYYSASPQGREEP
jgi:hypothetical protein